MDKREASNKYLIKSSGAGNVPREGRAADNDDMHWVAQVLVCGDQSVSDLR